jgi:hypothetical protein
MSSLTNPQSNYAAWEARGGRAHARNQRACWALMPTRRETVPPRVAPRETTAEAIAVFDAQFPWLRGAEKRLS